jgi:catechol O-methyltransferase
MNIGPCKGAFISQLIAERKPSTMIELGGYVGYSAILFGDAVHSTGGKEYISLEINPENAAVANMLIELAGLRVFVRIIVGSSNESLIKLIKVDKKISQIELLFIDHWKDLYLPDLLLEELNVLKPGISVLAADNVIMPGAPEYLEWVRASLAQKREMTEKRKLALSKDGVGNGATKDAVIDPSRVLGNPNLVYESTIEMFERPGGRTVRIPLPKISVLFCSCRTWNDTHECSIGRSRGHQSCWRRDYLTQSAQDMRFRTERNNNKFKRDKVQARID